MTPTILRIRKTELMPLGFALEQGASLIVTRANLVALALRAKQPAPSSGPVFSAARAFQEEWDAEIPFEDVRIQTFQDPGRLRAFIGTTRPIFYDLASALEATGPGRLDLDAASDPILLAHRLGLSRPGDIASAGISVGMPWPLGGTIDAALASAWMLGVLNAAIHQERVRHAVALEAGALSMGREAMRQKALDDAPLSGAVGPGGKKTVSVPDGYVAVRAGV